MEYELILKFNGTNYYIGDTVTVAGLAYVEEDAIGGSSSFNRYEATGVYTGPISDIIMMDCIPTVVFDVEELGQYIYFKVTNIKEML